jgi:hypothetical protein
VTSWLIDRSALVRLAVSPDAAEWAARIERGKVRVHLADLTVPHLDEDYDVIAESPASPRLPQRSLTRRALAASWVSTSRAICCAHSLGHGSCCRAPVCCAHSLGHG